jgi:hypothetical protein
MEHFLRPKFLDGVRKVFDGERLTSHGTKCSVDSIHKSGTTKFISFEV